MHTPEQLTSPRPSARQKRLQDMGFYAFVHYTVNTYTGKEWGDGTESPELFNPTDFDPAQWVDAIRSASMKGLILTCKHHDGFCLWPSRLTEHCVRHSPFRGGKGDVVREVADACRQAGLAFGIYLSPWDRHENTYGTGKPYDDYFVGQLTELLTGYGPIFDVWFDGACGEGANGKKQYYDWDRYYACVRQYQPEACISVCGPDVRWCGNEGGHTRESEWSVVSRRMLDTERIASLSQHTDSAAFRERPLRAQDQDLGSREALEGEKELIWYPAEVNTSIRPGWFYHREEDGLVKSLDTLRDIYLRSVGGNATFLLNIPPAPDGRFAGPDCMRLRELGDWLRGAFGHNVALEASLDAPAREGHPVACLLAEDGTFYMADTETPVITAVLPRPARPSYLVLREAIEESQRIERFEVDLGNGGQWKTVYRGTTVGSRKICVLPGEPCDAVRVRITSSRLCPTLAFLGLYD